MIKHTTNYDMFKKHVQNRSVIQASVDKLKKSIQMKNLLEFRPILVNGGMEVIDGQHRLQAARELGIPIYFEVDPNSSPQDMYILNSTMNKWGATQWMEYYANGGNREYQELRKFMEKNKLTLNHAMILLSGGTKISAKNGYGEKFYKGEFTFPKGEDYLSRIQMLEKISLFVDFICTKTPEYNHLINTGTLKKALIFFFNIHNVDFAVFMKKLELRLSIFRRCSRMDEYLKIFETIYNWKNQNPVSVQEIID